MPPAETPAHSVTHDEAPRGYRREKERRGRGRCPTAGGLVVVGRWRVVVHLEAHREDRGIRIAARILALQDELMWLQHQLDGRLWLWVLDQGGGDAESHLAEHFHRQTLVASGIDRLGGEPLRLAQHLAGVRVHGVDEQADVIEPVESDEVGELAEQVGEVALGLT